ncbi:MAG: sigma-70 family RNA polymerase sigma factor [Planctomycetota bacterium]
MTNEFEDTLELIRGLRDVAEDSLASLADRYRGVLLQRVRLMMGSDARRVADSSDFLQGLFLEMARDFDRRGPMDEAGFLRWATAIARNNIRDEVRRRRETALDRFASSLDWRPALGDASSTAPLDRIERREQVELLVEALTRLSEDHQQVIELRHFEGLSFAELGRRMGRSENAVQILHTRALVRLGEILRPED